MAINKVSDEVQNDSNESEAAEANEVFGDSSLPQTQVNADLKEMSAAPVGGMAMDTGLSEDEMGDLEIGFGSFPIIVLDDGFEAKGSDLDVEDGFDCVVQGFKAKYIYKVDSDTFFYTYWGGDKDFKNPPITAKGEPVADVLAEWKQDGDKWSVSKYLEVTALLVGGKDDGTIVLLSIPPASVTRFSGYAQFTVPLKTGSNIKSVTTRVDAGKSIKMGKFSFKPWEFSVA